MERGIFIYEIAVIAYVIFYTGIALGLRSYILYRNTGINPFKKMGQGGIQGINERVLMLGASLVPVIGFFYLQSREWYALLGPINYLEITIVKNIGILLMVLGSLVCMIAQFQMGDSWRIGINQKETTDLVQKGLYKFSRNPIYVGLLVSFLGFFFIAPNALSLSCLALSVPSVAVKIRLEEAYLLEKHGAAFKEYMNKVRRWI